MGGGDDSMWCAAWPGCSEKSLEIRAYIENMKEVNEDRELQPTMPSSCYQRH